MYMYAGFITLTPEFRESLEKAPKFLDEFKQHIESRKQDKAFRKGLRARIERAQRMIGN